MRHEPIYITCKRAWMRLPNSAVEVEEKTQTEIEGEHTKENTFFFFSLSTEAIVLLLLLLQEATAAAVVTEECQRDICYTYCNITRIYVRCFSCIFEFVHFFFKANMKESTQNANCKNLYLKQNNFGYSIEMEAQKAIKFTTRK